MTDPLSLTYDSVVFAVNRPDLLERAIDNFSPVCLPLTVLDNSPHGLQFNRREGVSVFRPPVPLTYSQSMNWMLSEALTAGTDLIFHFHSDAYTTNPAAASELLARARADLAAGHRVCCWYTCHDLCWIINTAALADIGGCDTTFPAYFTDDDLRMRWEKAGWERVVTGIEGVGHEGSATINSDPRLQFLNSRTFDLYAAQYARKWGGGTGHETFDWPYNNPELGLKP